MSSLVDIRRFAAPKAGRYFRGTFNGSGGTTTTGVCDGLKSSISQDNVYQDYWLYMPAASANDKVRIVSSYTASSGTLTVDKALSGASVVHSKVFELHGAVRPFDDDLNEVSWTSVINEGLRRCFLTWEITVSPTNNATRHDVSTSNTWLMNPGWVRQVGYLASTESRGEVDPYIGRRVAGQAERIGGTVYITHPGRTFLNGSETIYVKCVRSAYSLCRASGGTYGEQSGLALEADETPVPVEWAAYAALVHLADEVGGSLAEELKASIGKKREEWSRAFTMWTRTETNGLPELTFRPSLRVASYRHGPGH